jgi:hypothetical protein
MAWLAEGGGDLLSVIQSGAADPVKFVLSGGVHLTPLKTEVM